MVFDLALSILASAGTFALFAATFFVAMRARRTHQSQVSHGDLKLTVMKPMSGIDADLEKNLDSFAQLNAPSEFRVLLCLASEQDEAYQVAQRFAKKYPERFEISVGLVPNLANFKMAQLQAALPKVKTDFIWMSDSNVATTDAALQSLIGTWKDANASKRQVTLVHAPLVGTGGTGLGAALERVHLPSLQNPNHELGLCVGLHAVVGKSLFFHKDDLAAVGGFEAFGNYLGEDYMMSLAFSQRGVVKCANVATQNTLGPMSLNVWRARHLRWAVLRKTMVPLPFLIGEPLISLWVPVALGLLQLIPSQLVLALLALRIVIDVGNIKAVSKHPLRLADFFLSPVKELFLFIVWVQALFTFHVKWREGKAIRVGPNSVVVSKTDLTSKFRRHAESLKRVFTGSH
jgi:ceramide glucosyltransferase